jgi:hypothetical protein
MEFQMKYFNKYAILVALSALSFGAQATSISNSPSGLTGTFTTENFDTWDLDAMSGPGLSFDSGQYATDNLGAIFPNMSGNSILNISESISTFSFSGPVYGVAFNFVSFPANSIFTAFLGGVNGVEVGNFTALTGGIASNNFYGFKDIVFDSIQIAITNTNIDDYSSYALDNLQVASSFESSAVTQVPEPESYAMFMAGLGVMGFIARRRKDGQS